MKTRIKLITTVLSFLILSCNNVHTKNVCSNQIDSLSKRILKLETIIDSLNVKMENNADKNYFAFIAIKYKVCTMWNGDNGPRCTNWKYEVKLSEIFETIANIGEDQKFQFMDQFASSVKDPTYYEYEIIDRKYYLFESYSNASNEKLKISKNKSGSKLPDI